MHRFDGIRMRLENAKGSYRHSSNFAEATYAPFAPCTHVSWRTCSAGKAQSPQRAFKTCTNQAAMPPWRAGHLKWINVAATTGCASITNCRGNFTVQTTV